MKVRKRNTMRRYIPILLLGLLLSSCESFFETTLELEEPEFESQVNINAVFQNLTDVQRVLVTKTVGLNEDIDSSIIDDAEIHIIYPDGSKCDVKNYMESGDGFNYYGSCIGFQPNEEYQLEVKIEREELSILTSAVMPAASSFSDALYIEEGGLDSDGDDVSAVDVTINDPIETEDYYKFILFKKGLGFTQQMYLSSNDALTNQSAIYKAVILSDDQFNGQDYKLRLLFYKGGFDESSEEKLFLKATNISKDQYLFDKKLRQYQENSDNPFSSAIQLHDNIDGGLGIFAIENTQTISVE